MTQEMKKLLREFKTYIKEEDENLSPSNINGALAIIKFIVNNSEKVKDPAATRFVNAIQSIVNFAKIYDEAPVLDNKSAEDTEKIATMMQNPAVREQIINFANKMAIDPDLVEPLIKFLDQQVGEAAPEKLKQAFSDLENKKQEKQPSSYNITSGDIAPMGQIGSDDETRLRSNVNEPTAAPAFRKKRVTPVDSMLK